MVNLLDQATRKRGSLDAIPDLFRAKLSKDESCVDPMCRIHRSRPFDSALLSTAARHNGGRGGRRVGVLVLTKFARASSILVFASSQCSHARHARSSSADS